jgi:hypothetical protein
MRVLRWMIDRALRRHAEVSVGIIPGNHDEHLAHIARIALTMLYESEPRISIEQSADPYLWYRHGVCALSACHGHLAPEGRLPLVALAREPGDEKPRYRRMYVGHKHHDRVIEFPGVTIQYVRALAPKDAYAHGAAFDAGCGQTVDLWHARDGRLMSAYHEVR